MKSLTAIQIEAEKLEVIENGLPYFLATFSANLLSLDKTMTPLTNLSYSTMRLMSCLGVRAVVRLNCPVLESMAKQDPLSAVYNAAGYALRLISQYLHAQCSDEEVHIPGDLKEETQKAFESLWWAMDKHVRSINPNDSILTVCNHFIDTYKK